MSVFNIKKNILALALFSVILFTSFAFSFFIPEKAMACSVKLVEFGQPGKATAGNWYKDNDQIEITLNIVFNDSDKADPCQGQEVEAIILEKDIKSGPYTVYNDFTEVISTKNKIVKENILAFGFVLGDDGCEKNEGDSNDCEYYARIKFENGKIFTSTQNALKYECDGDCDKGWGLQAKQQWQNLKDDAKENVDTTFKPLVRLPGMPESFDTAPSAENPCPFGSYVNMIIKVLLGLYAVLAVIMIVKGGIEYMTSEISSSKEGGKRSITNAILGLAIALSAYLIINTINPRLLNVCFNNFPKAKITITGIGPDAGDNIFDPAFKTGGAPYKLKGFGSPGATRASNLLQFHEWKINRLVVHSSDNTMTIELEKGGVIDKDSKVNILPGWQGYESIGKGRNGDFKTPKGEWFIMEVKHTPGISQYNNEGSNMGYAFWKLNAMTDGERGIGIHGNIDGTLTTTNGCIRMTNIDMSILNKYIYRDLKVVIE